LRLNALTTAIRSRTSGERRGRRSNASPLTCAPPANGPVDCDGVERLDGTDGRAPVCGIGQFSRPEVFDLSGALLGVLLGALLGHPAGHDASIDGVEGVEGAPPDCGPVCGPRCWPGSAPG